MLQWRFHSKAGDGDVDGTKSSRITIEGDRTISRFDIFVREVLQNSLDAAIDDRKVEVHFKIRSLEAAEKTSFLNAMGWNELRKRIEACNQLRRIRSDAPEFDDPKKLEKSTLSILEIYERNTIGLVGLERIRSLSDERRGDDDLPKAYLALAREDARHEKQGLGAGGTHGLGKAVLWASSEVQTVLFFSKLSVPDTLTGASFRAAAQARLGAHILDDSNQFRGLGYGGVIEVASQGEPISRPLINQKAQSFAAALGIDNRNEDDRFGTSIVIPFWKAPDKHGKDESLADHVVIARSAARYFWPALESGKLTVTTESASGLTDSANNHLLHYLPFIDLYKKLQTADEEQSLIRGKVDFIVPKGPRDSDSEAASFIAVGLQYISPDDAVRDDFIRKVACIRGEGMVVGYEKMTGNTLVAPFVGLAVGGRCADDDEGGVRSDMLLGASEYVTHTRWDAGSDGLKKWPEAVASVRHLLDGIRNFFETNTREDAPDRDLNMSALEKGLKFPGRGRVGPPPPHPEGSPVLRTQYFKRVNNGYEFRFSARVNKDNAPCTVIASVEIAKETGDTSTKEDRISLRSIKVLPPDLINEIDENRRAKITLRRFDNDTRVEITGVTEDLPEALLSVSELILKARVKRI